MKTVLNVEGMSCAHCEKAIIKALTSLEGVQDVQVSLSGKTVTVQHDLDKVPVEKLKSQIEDEGYDVV